MKSKKKPAPPPPKAPTKVVQTKTKFLPYGAPDHPSVKMVDLHGVAPYGDAMNDGRVQLAFTLPLEPSPEAKATAEELIKKMGFSNIKICAMERPSEGFSFFVAFAATKHTVDFTKIKVLKVDTVYKGFDAINALIKEKVGRKLVVIGATTGFDAHTVGIDAIFNMKGYHGDYGLERYPWIDAHNLGAQVLNEDLLKAAVEKNADAILVSQVVDEKDCHINNLKALTKLAEQKGLKDRFIFIGGGPRLSHPVVVECGLDAGFGPGTLPSHVASYVVDEFLRRQEGLGKTSKADKKKKK